MHTAVSSHPVNHLERAPSEPVVIQGLTKRFGKPIAVDNLTLTAAAGQLTTLLGPSGCGKTTTLRMIAGFFFPDKGEIYIGTERITDQPPNKRPTRTVFQNYALFPHMTVRENVAFGLEVERVPRAQQRQWVDDILQVVGLDGMAERQPGQLSGGQQQRVALARALVTRPKVLLLDEPLSNLDAKLRVTMREEIRRLQTSLGITTLYVTHDQEEALSLSDKIAVMNNGQLLQFGSPAEIYERPVNRFVAQFLGLSNFLNGTVETSDAGNAVIRFGDYCVSVATSRAYAAGTAITVTIRPENLIVSSEGDGLPGRVISSSYLGAVARYHLHLEGQSDEVIADEHAPSGDRLYQPGDAVRVRLREGRGFVQ